MVEDVLEDIKYEDKSLSEWQEILSSRLPSYPCSSANLISAIIDINTKFQIACNCCNDLMVISSNANRELSNKLYTAVTEKYDEYKEHKTRVPAREAVEAIVISESDDLKDDKNCCQVLEISKQFFENIRYKLEKTMQVGRDLLYATSSTERATSKVEYHTNAY